MKHHSAFYLDRAAVRRTPQANNSSADWCSGIHCSSRSDLGLNRGAAPENRPAGPRQVLYESRLGAINRGLSFRRGRGSNTSSSAFKTASSNDRRSPGATEIPHTSLTYKRPQQIWDGSVLAQVEASIRPFLATWPSSPQHTGARSQPPLRSKRDENKPLSSSHIQQLSFPTRQPNGQLKALL